MTSLLYKDRVLDNVYGFIYLTAVEAEIVKLPVFARLMSIKQLSLTNRIFPGAEHSRYIHSLGVMYIIDKMAVALDYNSDDRQLARLAALLHDIGHYPLSHVGETAYLFASSPIFSTGDYLQTYEDEARKKLSKTKPDRIDFTPIQRPFHHETIGTLIIKSDLNIRTIIEKYCPQIKIDDLCTIITGRYDSDYNNSDGKLSSMIQLLHSELDADRMDYLLRDASFSGAAYGNFNIDVIINNLIEIDYGKVKIVGIKPKAISAVDQYLMNRFFSYTQITFNRHVVALEIMAVTLMRHMIRCNTKWKAASDFHKMFDRKLNGSDYHYLLTFTDAKFWTCVEDIASDGYELKGEPEYIKQFATMLIQYNELMRLAGTSSSEHADIERIFETSDCVSLNEMLEIMDNTLLENSGNPVACKLCSCNLTESYSDKDFMEELTKLAPDDEAKREMYISTRYENAISVIDESGGGIHLLIDDPRSMLHIRPRISARVLRFYSVNP